MYDIHFLHYTSGRSWVLFFGCGQSQSTGRPFIFLSATNGDVWIFQSFQIWDYMLHVEHVSSWIVANIGEATNNSLGLAGGKHNQKITIPVARPF